MKIINDNDVIAVDSELLQQRPHPVGHIVIQLAWMLILSLVLIAKLITFHL